MSRMLLDFDDDELSDCSVGDEDLLWDTDSTSTDSMYANDLLGIELFTIWELESYKSDDEDESSEEGDDDIASITSEELVKEEKRKNNKVVVSNLPSGYKVSSGEPQPHDDEEDEDDLSIDSTAGYEERWHVDESGNAKKSAFQDASWERDMKRREIQRKMRVLEQRISAIRGIVEPDTDHQDQQRRRRAGGRRRVGRSPGRGRVGRKKHRSLSPNRLPKRSMSPPNSPPRNSTFNDTLENRRKQVALARQKLQDRLATPGGGGGGGGNKSKPSSSSSGDGKKRLSNPRHLHRQAMKRMNPNVVPSRLRTI